jgi:hypothetical protein
MQTLTASNELLKGLNLEISDRMLRLETWYQDELKAYQSAKDKDFEAERVRIEQASKEEIDKVKTETQQVLQEAGIKLAELEH